MRECEGEHEEVRVRVRECEGEHEEVRVRECEGEEVRVGGLGVIVGEGCSSGRVGERGKGRVNRSYKTCV